MRTIVKRVPHGTSTYQAAWIPDFDDDDFVNDGGDSENEGGDDFNIDIEVDKMDALPVEKMEDETIDEPKKTKKVSPLLGRWFLILFLGDVQ